MKSRTLVFASLTEAESFGATLRGRPDIDVDGPVRPFVADSGVTYYAVTIRTWSLD